MYEAIIERRVVASANRIAPVRKMLGSANSAKFQL